MATLRGTFHLSENQCDRLHAELKALATGPNGVAFEMAAKMLRDAMQRAHKERAARMIAKIKLRHQLGV